jgi:hypothetical protein
MSKQERTTGLVMTITWVDDEPEYPETVPTGADVLDAARWAASEYAREVERELQVGLGKAATVRVMLESASGPSVRDRTKAKA